MDASFRARCPTCGVNQFGVIAEHCRITFDSATGLLPKRAKHTSRVPDQRDAAFGSRCRGLLACSIISTLGPPRGGHPVCPRVDYRAEGGGAGDLDELEMLRGRPALSVAPSGVRVDLSTISKRERRGCRGAACRR